MQNVLQFSKFQYSGGPYDILRNARSAKFRLLRIHPSTLAKNCFSIHLYRIIPLRKWLPTGAGFLRQLLLMYILKGTCFVTVDDQTMQATAGQLVLLDCYAPHAYGTDSGFEALWLHFDGPMARTFYEPLCSKKDLCSIQRTRMPFTDSSIISMILPQPCTNCRRSNFRHDHKYPDGFVNC